MASWLSPYPPRRQVLRGAFWAAASLSAPRSRACCTWPVCGATWSRSPGCRRREGEALAHRGAEAGWGKGPAGRWLGELCRCAKKLRVLSRHVRNPRSNYRVSSAGGTGHARRRRSERRGEPATRAARAKSPGPTGPEARRPLIVATMWGRGMAWTYAGLANCAAVPGESQPAGPGDSVPGAFAPHTASIIAPWRTWHPPDGGFVLALWLVTGGDWTSVRDQRSLPNPASMPYRPQSRTDLGAKSRGDKSDAERVSPSPRHTFTASPRPSYGDAAHRNPM